MQRLATKVFIVASITFGVLGIFNIFNETKEDTFLFKLFISTVFVILSSFALSVAGKYLSGKYGQGNIAQTPRLASRCLVIL